MSLFGSLMGDVEDDPFFGSHMRTMRQMNNMMNSMFSDPFGMMGGGPLAIGGPRHHGSALMPFMPQMPSLDRLFSGHNMMMAANSRPMHQVGDIDGMGTGSSFTSSTVIMSNGPNGKPQIISQSSSTKVGPGGIKETRKTLQDSRTGTKKMAIGHHIGERAHVIEREQNVYSGDAEERQEFINIDEEEAEQFDREFQTKAGSTLAGRGRSLQGARSSPPPHRLALPPAPSLASDKDKEGYIERRHRPAPRRPLRTSSSPLASSLTVAPMQLAPAPNNIPPIKTAVPVPPSPSGSGSVRDTYSGSHPQRHRHKPHKAHRHSPVRAPSHN